MVTKVKNSADIREALNENLHGLLTGTRKPLVVKEANNTLGKILSDVKMEMMNKIMAVENNGITWFGEITNVPLLESKQKETIKLK